jgi:nicotinamide riboside kinase
MIRRINFFAGPGAGKSTLAAKVFAEMKVRGHDVEHISEFVKTMAHEGHFPESYDQFYIMGQQLHREDVALRHVDMIVTDSPILLGAAYAQFYNFDAHEHLIAISEFFDEDFPALNFFIERTVKYDPKGRFQESSQVEAVDVALRRIMNSAPVEYEVVRVDQFDAIMEKIEEAIQGKDS